jgi:hypothetical protein
MTVRHCCLCNLATVIIVFLQHSVWVTEKNICSLTVYGFTVSLYSFKNQVYFLTIVFFILRL